MTFPPLRSCVDTCLADEEEAQQGNRWSEVRFCSRARRYCSIIHAALYSTVICKRPKLSGLGRCSKYNNKLHKKGKACLSNDCTVGQMCLPGRYHCYVNDRSRLLVWDVSVSIVAKEEERTARAMAARKNSFWGVPVRRD